MGTACGVIENWLLKTFSMKSYHFKSALLSLMVGLCSCSGVLKESTGEHSDPEYDQKFDPWRANNYALIAASKGDRSALDVFFLSGYVRLSQPILGGEDLGQMNENYGTLLRNLGDIEFSSALSRQRPEIRSAAKAFLAGRSINLAFPKTDALLKETPDIDWPIDHVN